MSTTLVRCPLQQLRYIYCFSFLSSWNQSWPFHNISCFHLLCLHDFYSCVVALPSKDLTFYFLLKGEELRKLIRAAAYIECSSITQLVIYLTCNRVSSFKILQLTSCWLYSNFEHVALKLQNVKAVFDAAIKVVLQPPKQKKKKKKGRNACNFL